MPVNLDALASAPGGWKLLRACRDPEKAQDALLRSILAEHANTELAREHALKPGMSFAAYQNAVPIRRYEGFAAEIDRMVHGEPNVLVRGRPYMFARTSGTSAKPKYVPVTKDGLHTFQLLAGLWTEMALADHPRAGAGRILALTSTAFELLPSGIPAGTTTYPRQTPPGIMHGRVVSIPPELHQPPDFERRRYLQLAFALTHDVSMIGVTAPTTLIVLFERLRAWGRELVTELEKQNAPRAQYLRSVLDRDQTLTPKTAWPLLSLIGSYIEGPSQMYVPRLATLTDHLPHRNAAYGASEGRFAVQLAQDHPAGVLVLSDYIVELAEENSTQTIRPWEAETGKRYRPIVTTPNGLYRYDMEDTIEIAGWFERAPLISFCHRSKMVTLAGENMTELLVVEAVRRATQKKAIEIVDFIAEPRWSPPAPAYYLFTVELAPDHALEETELAQAIEAALAEVNREYADKRRWARLDPAQVRLAKPGTFLELRHERLREGTPDTRFKQTHLKTQL